MTCGRSTPLGVASIILEQMYCVKGGGKNFAGHYLTGNLTVIRVPLPASVSSSNEPPAR